MKGIMFNTVFKLILILQLSAQLVSAAAKGTNSSTTVASTTVKPADLSGAETYETSVRLLRPGESVSRSVSYSQSSQKYEQDPGYDKGRYEEQTIRYEQDPESREEYYKGNTDDNYHGQQQQLRHSQADDYNNNFQDSYQHQQHAVNDERSYEGSPEQRNHYPYPEHSGKDQTSYVQHEYTKEVPYESTKEGKDYDAGRPPFHYAYEVSGQPQQQNSYQPLDVRNNAEKSEYGSGGTESYSPKVQQQPEYYSEPVPTRYVLQDIHKEENYGSEGQKDNYFPTIPKEAGYAPSGQKEPGYLHSLPKEHSYPKQAGYSPRVPDPSAFLPMIPKDKPAGVPENGKVEVFIKHLGHKTPGSNHYVNKERQGFLLLPVMREKVEEKLKELKDQFKQEYRQNYQADRQSRHRQRPEIQKQVYIQPKVVQYPANAKVHHGPSYTLEQVYEKPEIKSVVSHGGNGALRSAAYANSQYRTSKPRAHAEDDKEDTGPSPYLPQTISDYQVPHIKTYSRGSLLYGGPHTSISGLTSPVKYEPASFHGKTSEYATPYDVTTARKSAPIKVKGPSTYTFSSRGVDYPRIVHLSTAANKVKKNIPSSPSYSSQYKNIGGRLATAYEHPDEGKSVAIVLQKAKDPEVVGFQPTQYSSKGRVSAKTLVEDFGLHDYESFLSKPRHSTGVGSLYYDLHTFPAQHGYARFGYRRSGIVAKKPSL